MTRRKLELDRLDKKRIDLATRFLVSQESVPEDRTALDKAIRAFSKATQQPILRSDELLASATELPTSLAEKWRLLCRKRAIRSESGVAVVAMLTRNFGCPGKCVYCPTPANMPKSYLPTEPAVIRALTVRFSPSKQVRIRVKALEATGHDTSKVELIIMGGTWSAIPSSYQTSYIRACYHALNETKGLVKSLEAEQKLNESAPHRCVGLTLETRPDWITEKEIKKMRRFGCTRVEMGVQSLSDEVHNLCKRGHGVAEVITATELLRNAGFKVVYHMMLNLPGSNPKQDVEMFKELFSNPAFCPDQIKIYPCVLTKDAELATWYKDGKWKPYSDDVLADTIIKIKKFIPEYCRVIRVIRDIPSTDIVAGSKSSNLRQILQQKGMKCRCIRCREIRSLKVNALSLVNREYEAVGGKEIFISYEDNTQDKLVAMLRLRIPSGDSKMHFSALKYAAIVRELHVYGMHTPIGDKGKSAQHTGLGKKLLKEAERISKKHGKKKIAIISGIGVRDYYRKQGYTLKDEYMVKGI